jgi:hypothetical protein
MGKSVASRFDHIAMERSKLLGVVVDDDQLTLELDFCLEPSHPDYEDPGEGEEGCFHPGMIRFGGITKLSLERAEQTDTSQRRFAIQSFTVDGTRCDMVCDWGTIHLQARSIRVLTE